MLETWSNETFNADLEICTAFGALAKMAPPRSFGPWTRILAEARWAFFPVALRLDQNALCSAKIAHILDHLERAILPAFRYNKGLDDWFDDILPNCQRQKGPDPDLYITSACIAFGLSNYVTNKFTNESQLCHRLTNQIPSLLWSAGLLDVGFRRPLGGSPDASMIELILTHGVDPNCSFGGQSEWRLYLEGFAKYTGTEERKEYNVFDCVKAMLRYGANFKQKCTLSADQREIRADELLKEWFNTDQFGVLQDIVNNKKGKTISKRLRHLQLWIKSKNKSI
jgi:hypothetical protein